MKSHAVIDAEANAAVECAWPSIPFDYQGGDDCVRSDGDGGGEGSRKSAEAAKRKVMVVAGRRCLTARRIGLTSEVGGLAYLSRTGGRGRGVAVGGTRGGSLGVLRSAMAYRGSQEGHALQPAKTGSLRSIMSEDRLTIISLTYANRAVECAWPSIPGP